MHIKSILAGAAIALATTVGSAYAADQFTTLAGVPAQPLTVDAVENAASNRFAALEGIVAAIAFTPRRLGSPQGEHSFLSERDFPQIIVDLGKPPGGFTTMPTIDRNYCHIVAHGVAAGSNAPWRTRSISPAMALPL